MELPGAEIIPGDWDLRGRFDEYIGGIPVQNRSVLDVGTATGFLAFEAEKRGARVTAFDIDSGSYQYHVPFAGNLFLEDRDSWVHAADRHLCRMHNGFWYCHKRYNSTVRAIYGSFNDLSKCGEMFDVTIVGACFEHLADPVTALGILAKLTKQTLVIAWTPIALSEDIFMRPCVPWDNPLIEGGWYEMSVGMYRRLLMNLGFKIQAIHFVNAFYVNENVMAERPTLVARRIA
jgi:2-polyprenyl-3-methyl-5-hydroxy-6-metoxy-1,4-benzoquinol methylase